MSSRFAPSHPGEILLEEFLRPHGISQRKLAEEVGVPAQRINDLVRGKRSVSADIALRLSRYFGLSDGFWMNLQSRYDLEIEKDRLEGRLRKEVKVFAAGRTV